MRTQIRIGLISVLVVGGAALAQAQPAPPLGLRRLMTTPTADVPSVVPANKYSVDDLTPGMSGGYRAMKAGIQCLVLRPSQSWSRPLRGGGSEILFVSFSGYISLSTTVRVGGAWISLVESGSQGYAQLRAGRATADGAIEWKSLGVYVPLDFFQGKVLAALPVLTLRLNSAGGAWDVFNDANLVAEDLPFYTPPNTTNSPDVFVQAGIGPAWLTGLVMSDENPLYVDVNANAIDDAFEQQYQGSLLPANASAEARAGVARAWRKHQFTQLPPTLMRRQLRPDGPVM